MMVKGIRAVALLLAALLVLPLSACGSEKSADQSSSANEGSSAVSTAGNVSTVSAESSEIPEPKTESVKSGGYDKFSQLKIGMTESEVNAILGEPVRIDKAYYYYNITVNGQDMEVEVWINTTSGLVTYLNGDFGGDEYRAEFADSATDLSAADKLDSGELGTYDDCASAFKTPGYLTSIDEDGATRYIWVDANDGHLAVSFKPDGTVKSYVGYC